MTDTPTESSLSVEDQSALLYAKENKARDAVTRAAENLSLADGEFGADFISDEAETDFDEDIEPEEAAYELDNAITARQEAKQQSDEFGRTHMNELHEAALAEDAQRAAIAEAAQRVTDAYDASPTSEEKQ